MARLRTKDEILREIVSKHPYDLTSHELCWLSLNELFGEKDHLGIYCIRAIPIKILELYQRLNSPYVKQIKDLESFLQKYTKKIYTLTPRLFGFVRVEHKSSTTPKYIKDILLESGLCPYKNKSFPIYSYSYEKNRIFLENRFNDGCSALRCAICHGAALKKRLETYLKVAAMLYTVNPVETLKVIKLLSNNVQEYWDGDEINPEFVYLVNTQAGLPKDITKDDAKNIIEELAEKFE